MDPRKYLSRTELAFDLFRIYLGVGLFVRGLLILDDRSPFLRMLDPEWSTPLLIARAVVLCHLGGGLLLAAGCFTRWAAALQIPPVLAAVLFVQLREGLFVPGQSRELAALVLAALLLYALFGSGPLSLDGYLARTQRQRAEAAPKEPQPDRRSPLPGRGSPRRVTLATPSYEPRGAGQLPMPDSMDVARLYRDVKIELGAVLIWLTGLAVLVAIGQYTGAVAWFVVGFMIFAIWRVGHTHVD
jgi:uncharacterized membrane protein YphA (DoxX/SURF4 family)